MRTMLLISSLIVFATPSLAAPQSLEQKCRAMVGKEVSESEGRPHIGALQAQRFGECMMGVQR